MARSINRKCLACAALTADEAQQLHGAEGDGCWDAERCKKRRSHYRHRSDRNAKRVVQRRVQDSISEVARFSINVPVIATVVLIIYSEQPERFRDDTPIHAIAAELWTGTQKQAEIEPIVCLGMRGDKVTALFPQILEAFTQQFAKPYNDGRPFYKFAAKIHRHIRDCPIVSPFQSDSRS
ncbi:hypothetical protein ACQ4M3_00350 [Leptolyngbya sp. AN03gr2]|uniref:hypothetical protein n=1 Tax=unclassified Leptolyngbya TaxID=2650499 RepID=UPI003D31A569